MGACASKFSILKKATDAPPPAEFPSKEVNPGEEVVAVKNDASADDESKPQSLGHLFKEKEGEKKAEDGENVENAVKIEEVETLKREEDKAVEICGADKKPESPETKKNDEQKPTAYAEKKEEKPAEIIELETREMDAEKKKGEEKPMEIIKIETSEKAKAPETPEIEKKTEEQKPASDSVEKKAEEKPTEIIKIETSEKAKAPETPEIEKKTEEQKPASGSVEKKAEEKPTDNIKIETSDKHVLEPSKTEKPSDKKPDVESVEKHEIPEIKDAEKPKAEKVKTVK